MFDVGVCYIFYLFNGCLCEFLEGFIVINPWLNEDHRFFFKKLNFLLIFICRGRSMVPLLVWSVVSFDLFVFWVPQLPESSGVDIFPSTSFLVRRFSSTFGTCNNRTFLNSTDINIAYSYIFILKIIEYIYEPSFWVWSDLTAIMCAQELKLSWAWNLLLFVWIVAVSFSILTT
jgi:hypothetical protein